MRKILLDADVLVYQIGLAIERPIQWSDDLWTLHSDMAEGRRLLQEKVNRLVAELEADVVEVALSCPTEQGYRRKLCPTYKSNRTSRKPVCHTPLRDWLKDEYISVEMPQLEADDVLGILATDPNDTSERIIVTVDKDFQTIPTPIYYTNWDETRHPTPEDALRFFYRQCLMGDSVDGFAGVRGIGPKKAEKLLADVPLDECWSVVVAAYEKAGMSEEDALLTARMAHILQFDDWDVEKQQPILWTPPSDNTKS